MPWLKPHLYSDFQKALNRLDANGALESPRTLAAVASRSETAAEPVGSEDAPV